MPFIAARRSVLALLAVSAALIATSSDAAEAPPSLKGQLLIATPAMRDTRFDRAVILMVQHDGDGAMGIVINQPLGEKPLVIGCARAIGLRVAPAIKQIAPFATPAAGMTDCLGRGRTVIDNPQFVERTGAQHNLV